MVSNFVASDLSHTHISSFTNSLSDILEQKKIVFLGEMSVLRKKLFCKLFLIRKLLTYGNAEYIQF